MKETFKIAYQEVKFSKKLLFLLLFLFFITTFLIVILSIIEIKKKIQILMFIL